MNIHRTDEYDHFLLFVSISSENDLPDHASELPQDGYRCCDGMALTAWYIDRSGGTRKADMNRSHRYRYRATNGRVANADEIASPLFCIPNHFTRTIQNLTWKNGSHDEPFPPPDMPQLPVFSVRGDYLHGIPGRNSI
jgi:hypothetical protein